MERTVRLRELAAVDLETAIEHYSGEAGRQMALDLIDVVERSIRRIARNPGLGSLRFAHELGIPGLRAVPLRPFPYVMFYVAMDDSVDVWRILHTRRDIPAALSTTEG